MARSKRGIGVDDHHIHARHREDLGDSATHVSGADDGDVLHHSDQSVPQDQPHLQVDGGFPHSSSGLSAAELPNLDEVGTGILGLP